MAAVQEAAADVASRLSTAEMSSQSSVGSYDSMSQSGVSVGVGNSALKIGLGAIEEDGVSIASGISNSPGGKHPTTIGHSNSFQNSPSGHATAAGTAGAAAAVMLEYLDESVCRAFRLHIGTVTQVAISANGMWIFTAGNDGSIFMLATSKRAFEYTEIPQPIDTIENRFLIVDKSKLQVLRRRLADIENSMSLIKKDNDLMISKIIESKDRREAELKAKMNSEIAKRDEAIFLGRKEYLQLKSNMKTEIDAINKASHEAISDLELVYERKLAQESLYLDKMRQAYDEYMVHNKMNMTEMQKKTEARIASIEGEKQAALREAEKQKSTVLQYYDYVKIRNDEVMQSMEETQVEER